jgi:hypothetical protein
MGRKKRSDENMVTTFLYMHTQNYKQQDLPHPYRPMKWINPARMCMEYLADTLRLRHCSHQCATAVHC